MASCSSDFSVNIFDINTWTSIRKYTLHTNWVWSLDQIDNDTIVSGSWDNTFKIWLISTGQTIRTINVGFSVISVRVLLNGYQIICGIGRSANNMLIYNFTTGTLAQTLSKHTSNVNAIEILSEQYLISGSDDKVVVVWYLGSVSLGYTTKYVFTSFHTSTIYCIKRLSSTQVASTGSDNKIIIWDWLNGKLVYTLTGHNNSLYLSSLDLYDEQTLISGSWDKTIKFWNITNGQLLQTINSDIQIDAIAMTKTSLKLFFIYSELRLFDILYFFNPLGRFKH